MLPMQTLVIYLQADNLGDWAVHCQNAYHAELGMIAVLAYLG